MFQDTIVDSLLIRRLQIFHRSLASTFSTPNNTGSSSPFPSFLLPSLYPRLPLTFLSRFYGGNLVFRDHFTASGSETAVNLTVQGGLAFAYSIFLNGVFLGSGGSDPSLSLSTDVWTFPEEAVRVGKDNVLTVLQGKLGVDSGM